jgi:hypothetical protein
MLACSDAPPLVLGTGELRRFTSPQGAAVGAGDLAVVTRSADADFAIAAHAAEETSLRIDHWTPTGDVSGHGRGVERWSTSERRLDHRDDPEGSGRSPRAFALSAGPWGYPTRPAPPRKRSPRPRLGGRTEAVRLRAVTPRLLQARYASAHRQRARQHQGARGSAPTSSSRWTPVPLPSPFTTATTWIWMSPRSGEATSPRTPRAPSGQREPVPGDPGENGTLRGRR